MLKRRFHWRQTAPTPDTDWSSLLDSLSDAVMIFSPGGRLEYINRAWQRISGHDSDAALGQPFHRFLHPEDAPRWQQALLHQQANPDQGTNMIWLRLLQANREVCWCELRLQTLGTRGQLSATLCDITGQVHDNQQRDASHRSLSSLIQRLPIMIYRSRNDRDWTMEYVSDGCEMLTGMTAQQMINLPQKSFGAMIHPSDANRVWQDVQQALNQHDYFETRYRVFHSDGTLRDVIDKGCGVYTRSGAILAVEGVVMPIDS